MTITLGERIRQARTSAGLTQQEAADRAGIAQSTWAGYESNTRGNTLLDRLGEIARALGVDLGELLIHQ